MAPSESAALQGNFSQTVIDRFGLLPNFFQTARAAPGLIEEFWAFAKSAYLDNPLPSLFKERLFVHLSRFCEVRYCVVRHVGFLIGQGRAAGDQRVEAQSVEDAVRLLSRRVPDAAALERIFKRMDRCTPSGEMPLSGTAEEADLFDALSVMFIEPHRSARARRAVERMAGETFFELLAAFLAFVRTAHYWTEMHPDLEIEPDMIAIMEQHRELARLMMSKTDAQLAAGNDRLRRAWHELDLAEAELDVSERLVRRNELWLDAQNQAFMAAMNDGLLEASLGILTDAVARNAEDDRRCAFYISSPGGRLRHIVGMSESYARAVDGLTVSPESFAYGLAVAEGMPILTVDVQEEPRWQPWRWLAREHNYRGCWSFPVETATGKLVGAFAIYLREPGAPGEQDLELAKTLTKTAAIIISRDQENEERIKTGEQLIVVVAELQHRTRNLMGVVRSLADKTMRSSSDLPDFRSRYGNRLDALARVQDLLSRLRDQDRVSFDELIHTELAAVGASPERLTCEGPADIKIRSSTVQMLAMALHELATNAIKYGALGQPAAHLAVIWTLEQPETDGDPWLHIDWRESGVTMPASGPAPSGTGQGCELIEKALPYQLNAKTSHVLGRDGVHCTISLPISKTALGVGHA